MSGERRLEVLLVPSTRLIDGPFGFLGRGRHRRTAGRALLDVLLLERRSHRRSGSRVLATRIGDLKGNEVVEVTYDPQRTGLPDLVAALKGNSAFYSLIVPDESARGKAAQVVPISEIRVESSLANFIESKYSLKVKRPDLYYLDLTEEQALALNSWCYFGGKMPNVLTPEQLAKADAIRAKLEGRGAPGVPERSGIGLQQYRRRLSKWLSQ